MLASRFAASGGETASGQLPAWRVETSGVDDDIYGLWYGDCDCSVSHDELAHCSL